MHDVYLLIGLALALVAKLSHTMFKDTDVTKRDIILLMSLVVMAACVMIHIVWKAPETEIAEEVVEEVIRTELEVG